MNLAPVHVLNTSTEHTVGCCNRPNCALFYIPCALPLQEVWHPCIVYTIATKMQTIYRLLMNDSMLTIVPYKALTAYSASSGA